MRFILIVIVLFLVGTSVYAEKKTVNGRCYDNETKVALHGVLILNIYTGVITTSDSLGYFSLEMEDEELIEFKMLGYNTARIRMRSFLNAKFYNIGMTHTPADIKIKEDKGYYADSVRWARFYAFELSKKPMSLQDWLYRPWEAASKTNKKKWQLQKSFKTYLSTKYVEEYFNEEFIKSISPLRGTDLRSYMILMRPNPEFVRSLSRYDFMLWIKRTANDFYEKRKYETIQHQ